MSQADKKQILAAEAAASGPTAALPKEPQPSVDRIDELAHRIRVGDILLPKFQRDFVWARNQILDLLDSIVKNYPVGSILLWQSKQELRSENRIADLEIKLPKPEYPVNYLLDGQQRLSTICGVLFWDGANPNSVWNVVYDLREKKFSHLDPLDDPPQHQIRMTKLSAPSVFYKHVATLDSLQAPDKDVLKANADELFNRFKDYKIAVVTLGDMLIQDVAPIFERINSTGTKLTIVDLMRAATWSQDFDLIDAIDQVVETLASKDFGGIDRKAVLRNISAAVGGGFSSDSIDSLRNYSAEDLKAAVAKTEEAYKRTVDFLATQIKIPNDAMVPYVNQIVVLAEIFRLIPAPKAEQFEKIREWFWRTAYSSYFSGWNTGMMKADQIAVAEFASGSKGDVAAAVTRPPKSIWLNRQFRTNGAHAKLLAIVCSYHQPLDLLTGQNVDTAKALAWVNSKEYHHFFPQDYLKGKGVDSAKISCLANIVMLSSSSNKKITNRAPSDYLKEVETSAGAKLAERLSSNLISQEAYERAKKDDYDGYLERRIETLNETLLSLCNW